MGRIVTFCDIEVKKTKWKREVMGGREMGGKNGMGRMMENDGKGRRGEGTERKKYEEEGRGKGFTYKDGM